MCYTNQSELTLKRISLRLNMTLLSIIETYLNMCSVIISQVWSTFAGNMSSTLSVKGNYPPRMDLRRIINNDTQCR